MRDFKGMKRQRNRGRGGGGGGGGKPQHNANRAFDSNGPDGVKVRGAAQHVYEKYQQLARDAGSAGDRVLAENYLQHAEHYFRVLRAMQPQRPVAEIIGRDQFVSGYDIDFEDEAQAGEETAEAEADGGQSARASGRGSATTAARGSAAGRVSPAERPQRMTVSRASTGNRDDRRKAAARASIARARIGSRASAARASAPRPRYRSAMTGRRRRSRPRDDRPATTATRRYQRDDRRFRRTARRAATATYQGDRSAAPGPRFPAERPSAIR